METKQAEQVIEMELEPRQAPLPVIQQSTALAATPVTPGDLLRYALDSGADLDRLEKLMDLQMKFEANEARKAFASDMAEFKKNPPTIYKDKHVSFGEGRNKTDYDHATIGNVVEKVVAAAAEHGFSHRWDPTQQDGRVIIECVVTHRLGHSQTTKLEASPDSSGGKNGIQSIVSAKSYLERHTLLAAFGLATKDQEDDDGAGTQQPEVAPDAAQWAAKAKAAPTMNDLNEVWNAGEPKFTAANDKAGLDQLRAACNARQAEIKAARAAAPNSSSRLRDIVGERGAGQEQQP